MAPERLARSYLYVPGDAAERLTRSVTRGADAVIADLEDAVALSHKDLALDTVNSWLAATHSHSTELWVRVNQGQRGLDEIATLNFEHLAGLCLPKVGGPEDVERVAALLDDLEGARSADRPVTIIPLIETAAAVQDLARIASAPRVLRLQIGEIDLAADLGVVDDDEPNALALSRASVVIASVAARLAPPIGAVSADYRDLERFRATTQRQRNGGFVGRAAIHPAQIPVIHEVYSATVEELERARYLVDQYEEALARGDGVIVGEDGRMIDEAVVRQSRRLLMYANYDSTSHSDDNGGKQ